MKCYVIDTRKMRKDVRKRLLSRGTLIKVAGVTAILLIGLPDVSHAATGIDEGAGKIYKKLLNVGKWVIIVKGGLDTVKHVADGDTLSARKNFLGYMLTYAILWALPWGFKEIENLFEGMGE